MAQYRFWYVGVSATAQRLSWDGTQWVDMDAVAVNASVAASVINIRATIPAVLSPSISSATVISAVIRVSAAVGNPSIGSPGIPVSQTSPWQQIYTEMIPVGTFVITNPSTSFPQITIQGSDRMWMLSNFTSPYAIAAGTNITTALTQLLSEYVPSARLSMNFPDTEQTTAAVTYDAQTAVSDAAAALARAAGWQFYCDPMGTFTADVEHTIEDDPVMTYAAAPGSMLYRPERDIGTGTMYNAVVFTGEKADGTTPVQGYAQDNDPKSLTYVARIGVRPYFASSPLMTTVAQCNLAAQTELQRILGISSTVTVPIIPNHALEVSDVIQVTDPAQALDAKLLIDSFSIGIRASDGVQTLTCRSAGPVDTS